MMLWPEPPMITLRPSPPIKLSLPAPPKMESLPKPPSMRLFWESPVIFSEKALPTIFSKFLEFIWENYNADKLHCEAFEKNRGLRNMVINAGFELEGVRKNHKLRNGIPENILLFGILNPRKYNRNSTL